VADVAGVAATLPSAPILIGHSMGGFVVQKYLEERSAPAAVLLASSPPGGVWRLALRATWDQPLDVLKGNLFLSLWPLISDPRRAGRLLFSPSMPEEEVERHHKKLQDESFFSYLDTLVRDLVDTRRVKTPMIVLGAGNDAMIKLNEVAATAKAYNVQPTVINGIAHDMMLDIGWRRVADTIVKQLQLRFPSQIPVQDLQSTAA